MTPFAWLLGFWLPACAAAGAHGLAVPPPMDTVHLTRPPSHNTALAAPAGFRPAPDIATPAYRVPPQRLYAAIRAVAAAQPRTFPAADYPQRMQAHWVVRSAVWNFPDLVTAQVSATPDGGATLMLYSRSVYGYSDLGANRRRVEAWLAALDQALEPATER